jgi:uncharacterized protein YdaT
MPWDATGFKHRHNHSLSDMQAAKASEIANAVLRRTGDEGLAIRVANARAKKGRLASLLKR